MRGTENQTDALFVYVSPESFVPGNHPLRPIREMADKALQGLSQDFDRMYSHTGRPSVPPEVLLKSLLLRILYSVRNTRLLVEQLGDNVLFRWFLGMSLEESNWGSFDVFAEPGAADRFGDIRAIFVGGDRPGAGGRLLSDDHFSVDRTFIDVWAWIRGFRPRDGQGDSPVVRNAAHGSVTDADARLHRKGRGKEAKLCYLGHALMENWNGLLVDSRVHDHDGNGGAGDGGGDGGGFARNSSCSRLAVIRATSPGHSWGRCSRCVQCLMFRRTIAALGQRSAVGRRGIPGCDECEGLQVDRRELRLDQGRGLKKARHRGVKKVSWYFTLTAAAHNLVGMRNFGVLPSG